MSWVKEIRKKTGLSQDKFAQRYGIPVRTLQNWEQEYREPPAYVIAMLERLIAYEVKLGEVAYEKED